MPGKALKAALKLVRDRLDGNQKPVPYSVLLRRPDLRHRASITK